MNTSISSKREFVAPQVSWNGSSYAVMGLIAGFVLMILGIAVNITAIAGIGFVALTSSFLYLNSMFWARVMEDKDLSQRIRESRGNWY